MIKKIIELLYTNDYIQDVTGNNIGISQQILILLWLTFCVFACYIAVRWTYEECKSITLSIIIFITSVFVLWCSGILIIALICVPYINIVCYIILICLLIDTFKKKDIIEKIKKMNININTAKVKNNKWSKIRYEKYKDLYEHYDYSIYNAMKDIKYLTNRLIKYNYHIELIYECEQKIFALIESSSCQSGNRYVITDKALKEVIDVINNFGKMLGEMEEKMREQEKNSVENYCNNSKRQREELNELIKSMTKDIKELF